MKTAVFVAVLMMAVPALAFGFQPAVVLAYVVDPPNVTAHIGASVGGYACSYSVADSDDGENITATVVLSKNGEIASNEEKHLGVDLKYSTAPVAAAAGDRLTCLVEATDKFGVTRSDTASFEMPLPASPTGFAIAVPDGIKPAAGEIFTGFASFLKKSFEVLFNSVFG